MGPMPLGRALGLFLLVCSLAAPGWAADYKDFLGTRQPVAAEFQQFLYIPPRAPKELASEFWNTIYRLERKHAAYGSQQGHENLVPDIRRNLGKLSPRRQRRVMARFLNISHHYTGAEDARKPESLREFHRAQFLDQVTRFAKVARRIYEIRKDPTMLELFANVRALASAGPEGVRLSRLLAGIDPRNARVQRNYAQDLLDVGDLDQAVKASRRATQLDPSAAQPYTMMASAKYALRDYSGAYKAANRALHRDPGDKIAYSIMKLSQSRVPEAIKAPPIEDLGEYEAQALGIKDAPAAVPALLAPVGARSPLAAADALAARSRLAIMKGKFPEAASLATRSLEKNPQNPVALFRRAVANLRRGLPRAALKDVNRAIEVMGKDASPALWMLRSKIHNELGDYRDALASGNSGLKAGAATPRMRAQLHFQKARALGGLGRRREALEFLAAAARLDRRFVPYYQEALSLPADTDLAALLGGDLAPDAAAAPAREDSAEDGDRRLLMIVVLTLIGGFLVALGLLQSLSRRPSRAAAAAQTPVDIAPPSSGLIAGAYRITRKIGVGGMGVVYDAMDVNLERRVAIKKMREEIGCDVRERERFLREARTVARLRHPNIVEIYAVVGEPPDIYLVFEHVDGHTVDEYIHHYQRLKLSQALSILKGTAAALEFAHSRGVIHRDLKPSNIMINREGTVKVMDFGVARQAKDSLDTLSHTHTITGTPPYMAPEQEQGRAGRKSDIFAMTVCLYELLTGKLPFVGTGGGMSLAKLNKIYVPPSRVVPGLPRGIDSLISRGLDPDPAKRPATPLRLLRGVQDLLSPA